MADILAEIWDSILEHVQRNDSEHWRNWFEQIEPITMDNGTLRLGVPERSWISYLQQNCHTSIVEAAGRTTGHLIAVEYILLDGQDSDSEAVSGEGADETRGVRTKNSGNGHANGNGNLFDDGEFLYFSPDYTFSQFVVGPCNRMAHAACQAVSESPGDVYNPLFIHGSVGLGKTHLLQGTSQAMLKQNSTLKILYLSCETFINHFIRAVEEGKLYDFRYKYRYVDMLVIDDVQFLSERERSQEEFFHTFNSLYQGRKQIILSADCPPSEIPKLEERLVSRFNQGLVTRIDKPCYETRMAIVRKKAHMRGIQPPDEVISFIARKVESNIRELEGALTKVHGLAMLEGCPITLELARQALGEDPSPPHRQVTISQIIDSVTNHFNTRLSDLQGKRRSRSVAFPRQICMYLARDLTVHSLEEIGGHFGGRDHTTVLHACRTIERQCDQDDNVRATVNKLIVELTQS